MQQTFCVFRTPTVHYINGHRRQLGELLYHRHKFIVRVLADTGRLNAEPIPLFDDSLTVFIPFLQGIHFDAVRIMLGFPDDHPNDVRTIFVCRCQHIQRERIHHLTHDCIRNTRLLLRKQRLYLLHGVEHSPVLLVGLIFQKAKL